MIGRLLILGASARAAAMSARRSGFECWAADRFFDLDLQHCCTAVRAENHVAFESLLAAAPAAPWMYTGALENQPELIDRLARIRPLLGMSGAALRAVRKPMLLGAVLRQAGFPTPDCALASDMLPLDGTWLIKPVAGANGLWIQPWLEPVATFRTATSPVPSYFQRRVHGIPVGAMFIAAGGRATLLGMTRQMLGVSWCGVAARGGHEFRYCGSIGPLVLSLPDRTRFDELGNLLAAEFSLVGLFGVDAILGQSAGGTTEIWPIEVNPRYTASVEVLERGGGIDPIRWHVAACSGDVLSARQVSSAVAGGVQDRQSANRRTWFNGKAILYAEQDLEIKAEFVSWIDGCNRGRDWPTVADIPQVGTAVRRGHPVVSLFATAADDRSTLAELQRLAAEIKARLI